MYIISIHLCKHKKSCFNRYLFILGLEILRVMTYNAAGASAKCNLLS